LLYRAPTDSPEHNQSFYNDGSYRSGFTTRLPDASQLEQLKRTKFSNSPKDYSAYINILCKLGIKAPQRLFDFGCSWGYGSHQLQSYGLEVVASEISIDRRNFAQQNLNVRLFNELAMLDRDHPLSCSFDCFFSAHVLEHVPSPKNVIAHADELLRPGGVFVAFVPNGCESHRQRNPNWNKLWGEPHPNVIDDRFLRQSFERWPRLFASSPYNVESLQRPSRGEMIVDDLSGGELLFVASKPHDARDTDGLGRASERPGPGAF
jgi:SAM-dependent methyltransferase